MITLAGAGIGGLAATGVLLVVIGSCQLPVSSRTMSAPDWRLGRTPLVAAAAGMVGWAASGWPAVGLLSGAAAWVTPSLLEARRSRRMSLERTAALASWAEMLRDTIGSHAGLREAIGVTAPLTPDAIGPEVRRLAGRAEHETLRSALARFAVEVGDPVADLIVAALTVAADGQARNLPALLSSIAGAARAEAGMRIRVEAGRARTYSSSQALVCITFGLSVLLLAFAPDFMAPYGRPWGQLVLTVIGVLFAGALWGLVALGRPAPAPRLLGGVSEEWEVGP